MKCIFPLLVILGTCLFLGRADGASTLPAAPGQYFTDTTGRLSGDFGENLNRELADFERDTSNQLVVYVTGKLPDGEEIAHYSTEVFHAWGVGQKEKDNGVIFFVFLDSRKTFIATGRGLEGALPDALCKRIIEQEVIPRFKNQDYQGGVNAGAHAIMLATKGEYKGNGTTVRDDGGGWVWFILLGWVGVLILLMCLPRRRLSRRGGWSGGSWYTGGGGGGSGGGGGFGGGGGDSGGGGAGGSW